MTKFIVEETYPVWVTWRKEIEATTEQEALDAYNEGNGTLIGTPELGDILDSYDVIQTVTKA